MSTILLIDDDTDIITMIKTYLEKQEDRVLTATSGKEGLSLIMKEDIDCIILDVLLTGENGFDLCRDIKNITEVPIIFLTNLGSEDDLKTGFLCGGDDYITKPFSFTELELRIRARIRQYHQIPSQKLLSYPPLEINMDTRQVSVEGERITLTISEFDILVLLASSDEHIYTISEIYQAVWKMPDMDSAHTVQVHIANLRKKLDIAYPEHHFIQTVWGKGYKFSSIKKAG